MKNKELEGIDSILLNENNVRMLLEMIFSILTKGQIKEVEDMLRKLEDK